MRTLKRIFHYYFQNPITVPPFNKKAALIGGILLIIAGIRVYYNLYHYMDIVYGDEVVYMKTGLNLTKDFNRDWGPLYGIWYKLLSYFIQDSVQLYYFNYAFIAIIATVMIYLAFLAMNIHPLVALYFAICFVSSRAIVPMWPRISLFTITILMAGVIIVSRMRELYIRLLVFSVVLLLASYARPELYLSFIISITILVLYYFAEKKYLKKFSPYRFVVFVLIVALLHLIFQFPSNTYNGYPRNLAAFYQHYFVNLFFQHKATEYDWIYWKDMYKTVFGNSQSIFDIIFHYPKEFFPHILYNIKNYTIEIFTKNLAIISPYLFGMNKMYFAGSVSVFLFSIVLLFFKNIRQSFLQSLKSQVFFLIMLMIWGLPTFISSIVIFPREHYILLNYFLFIVPLALLFSIFVRQFSFLNSNKYLLVLALVFIPFLSSSKYFSFFLTDHDKNNMCSRKALEHIKNMHLDKNKQYMFFADIHYFIGFLPNNFKEINTMFDKTKDIPFSTILEYHKPDFILVNNCINYSPSLNNDATWHTFIKNPYTYGYHYEFVKDCPYYYLVRNSVNDKK